MDAKEERQNRKCLDDDVWLVRTKSYCTERCTVWPTDWRLTIKVR